jgi:hypothetical protein
LPRFIHPLSHTTQPVFSYLTFQFEAFSAMFVYFYLINLFMEGPV